MKKLLAVLLAITMLCLFAACGGNPEDSSNTEKPDETTASSDPTTGTDGGTEKPPIPAPTTIDQIPVETILYLLTDMTDVDLNYMNRQALDKESAGRAIGYADFSGEFESAMALMPQMNVTPFVLAVFRLAEGQDADAFEKDIAEHANLNKWVCVSADKVVTRVSGRTVLFMMCSERFERPITEAFETIAIPDFKVEEHLKDPMKGISAADLYEKLYETYSTEMYGFMDGKELASVTAESGYGLSLLDSKCFTASVLDEGHSLPDDIFLDERAYLLAMFDLAEGVSAKEFASSLADKLDLTALKGEGAPEGLIAYADRFVLVFAGTGSNTYSSYSLRADLENLYRMTVTELSFG